MKIKKTNNTIKSINILVYGQSGVGKTTLASTLPTEKTIILSAESGLLSIANSNMDYIDVTDGDKMQNIKEFINFIQKDDKYKYVFIDSLTEISQIFVEYLQNKYPDKRDSFNLWGDYNKYIKSFIKTFRDLNKTVIFTALEKHDKDYMQKRLIMPDLAGKIAFQCVALFDEVLYYTVLEKESGEKFRVLVSDADNEFIAKDRSGKLSKYVKPDLDFIIKEVLR